MAFTPGVVAFTRVIATDRIGMQVGASAVATQLGQILDADIYFNPSGSPTTYPTPQVLASNPTAYDLESVLTHELGARAWIQSFGRLERDHVSVRGGAWNFRRDAPHGAATRCASRGRRSDRTPRALRQPVGCAACRIDSRANFSRKPAGATRFTPWSDGSFWRPGRRRGCGERRSRGFDDGRMELRGAGPVQFDGGYEIDGLTVGHSYIVYAEALNGAVDSSSISNAIVTLCRNTMTDPGWPPLQDALCRQ